MNRALLESLADVRGEGVRVAIVDSGVEGTHPWVGGRLVASYAVQSTGNGWEVVENPPEDPVGHGTASAGQIRRYAPKAEILAIRVLNASLRASSEALLEALRWLYETRAATVVNMSLSTQRVDLALQIGHAVDDLWSKDVTCVCARGYHRTGRAYPTYNASTIGVSFKDLPLSAVEFRPQDLIEFDAAGIDVEVAWSGGSVIKATGSSYACPLVTGLVARILSARPDLTPYEVRSLLKAHAMQVASGDMPPWLEEVAAAPVG